MRGYDGKQYYEEGFSKVATAFENGCGEAALYLAEGCICGNKPCPREAKARCGGCGLIRYCSKECQIEAWETHSVKCQSVEERHPFEKYCELAEEAHDSYDLREFEEAEKFAKDAVSMYYSHYDGHLILAQSRVPQGKLQLLVDDLEAYMNSPLFDSSISTSNDPEKTRADFLKLAALSYRLLNDDAGLRRITEKMNRLGLTG